MTLLAVLLIAAVYIGVSGEQVQQLGAECRDLILPQEPAQCSVLPNICEDDPFSAHILCPKFCGHCDVYKEWADMFLNVSEKITCEDDAPHQLCEFYKEQCHNPLPRRLCAKTCAHAEFKCRDHVFGINYNCSELANVCDHALAAVLLCPKFCNLCEASEAAYLSRDKCYPCSDTTTFIVCNSPGMCDSIHSALFCLRTCHNCEYPTPEPVPTTTAATTTPTTTTPTTVTTIPTTVTTTPSTVTTTPTTVTTTPSTVTTTPTTVTTTPATVHTTPVIVTSTPTTVTTTLTTTTATTMPTTTTPKPTATSTMASTTTAGNSLPGSKCVTCGNPSNEESCTDEELIEAPSTQCDDATPYCMNEIFVKDSVTTLYKSCVNESTCDKLWYQGTSDKPVCLEFNPSAPTEDMVCYFCCYGTECNYDDVPPDNLMYKP